LTLLLVPLPFIRGRRVVEVCSEELPEVGTSWSASVLGGVVLSEEVSPRVVEERLTRLESSELELRFVLEVDCDILRRDWNKDGIAKGVGRTPRSTCGSGNYYQSDRRWAGSIDKSDG
jgi:hypothetical protein